MHLIAGFVRIMLANLLAAVYRRVRIDTIGRRAVRLSCSAFSAGAGLDDQAFLVLRGMGAEGERLLKAESLRPGNRSVETRLLKMLESARTA